MFGTTTIKSMVSESSKQILTKLTNKMNREAVKSKKLHSNKAKATEPP